MPKDDFFRAPSWSQLGDWRAELAPHYATARRMLGAAANPTVTPADRVLRSIARDLDKEKDFHATDVGVFFGEPGVEVPDPFFGGEGPPRVGCNHCGGCMTGCRVGAKNTLDRNYLYLAEKKGVRVLAETEVVEVRSLGEGKGYGIEVRHTFDEHDPRSFTADRVVLAGGVMGTLPLLLRMREEGALPRLSERVGQDVRTNNEALIGVIVPRGGEDLSTGIAITSILETDAHSHVEPVRYGGGSGFFRTLALPHAPGPTALRRLGGAIAGMAREPGRWARALTVPDFARHTQILLYMRTLESTLTFRLGRSPYTGFARGLVSELPEGATAPTAFMEEATDLAHRYAEKTGGVAMTLLTETLMGTPSTAHILGGACMGVGPGQGVIDARHQVHGHPGLYVIDGSAISANPGVNPSLTITALAERAMSLVPARSA